MKTSIVKDKIRRIFNQGLSPIKLSQSIIVAGALSIIPIFGFGVVTSFMTVLSIKKKLNLPIMLAIIYSMWPIQALLIIPFIRIGERIFSIPPINLSLEEIINSFENSFFQTLRNLGFELLCGVGGWFFTVIPSAIIIYLATLLFLKIDAKKRAKQL